MHDEDTRQSVYFREILCEHNLILSSIWEMTSSFSIGQKVKSHYSVDITEILEINRGRERRIGFPKLVPDLFRDILKARLNHEFVDCFGGK